MNWTDSLVSFMHTHGAAIALALSALMLFLIISNLYLVLKLGKLSKHVKSVKAAVSELPGSSGWESAQRLVRSEEEIARLGERHNKLHEQFARSVQRIGLVRFDAFPDVGGEQSFALALLDREMNGVVISNLYSRSDSRVYAKEVTGGRSQHALSDEELEAIRRAGDL